MTENKEQSVENFLKTQDPPIFFMLNYAVRRVLASTNCLRDGFI